MRRNLDHYAAVYAALAALGGSVGGLLLGAFGPSPPYGYPYTGTVLYETFGIPAIPAAAAFFACTCNHRPPMGWPVVRVVAAGSAYFGFASLGVIAISFVRLIRFAAVSEVILWIGGPLGLTFGTTLLTTWITHRRTGREFTESPPVRPRLLRKVEVYSILSLAYAVLAIPLLAELTMRTSFIALILTVPFFFLFLLGSIKWLRAAFSPDARVGSRDIAAAIALQATPLLLIGLFSYSAFVQYLAFGGYSWSNAYYDITFVDPSLLVTPLVGIALFAWLSFMVATKWRPDKFGGHAGAAPP